MSGPTDTLPGFTPLNLKVTMDASSPAGRRTGNRWSQEAEAKFQTCFLDECPQIRVKNQKWCEDHKRAYAVMYANAKKRNQVEDFQETMSDDDRAKACMRTHCKNNPVGARWSRKKIIDFAEYNQRHGKREYEGELDGDKPMTEFEFLHWAKDTKRLTAQGAQKWWDELEASSCDRDQKGRDPAGNTGQLRLWVPVEEMRERKRGRYSDSSVLEKSKAMKNLDEEALNQLKDFAGVRASDSEFMRGRKLAQQEAAPETPASSKDESLAGLESEGSPPAKSVDLGLEKPKLTARLNGESRASFQSLSEAFKKAVEQWRRLPDDKDRRLDMG